MTRSVPSWRFSTLLACGLSLAVGWGIRGNFGHEYGAAFAGCLAVMAACILSGREDWRRRIAYFAFFGMLGWGFGGSISYMKVIAYTHTGHASSQLYGFFGLFYIGFLWAALGGAGAALPAVADRERLTQFFKPILWVFAIWAALPWIESGLEGALQTATASIVDNSWHRHESPLYWFDADYLQAFSALLALCLYDLYDRRSKDSSLAILFGAGGAFCGWLVQFLLRTGGLEQRVGAFLTYQLGDPSAANPDTGAVYGSENFLNNWPQWFGDFPQHIGWVVGLILGVTVYFWRYGKFRNGASLFVYMAGGWLLCFLAFPVLGSLFVAEHGGIRMTPPRSDDWAGITGVFIGMTIWMLRYGWREVAFASVVSGFIGGAGFSGIAWLKLMMIAPGNSEKFRAMAADGTLSQEAAQAIIEKWAPWQSQNWHSFLEQSYGFVNGIAVAVALGLLATRVKEQPDDNPPRRWTEAAAAFFVLVALTYVNLFKNVVVWFDHLKTTIWKNEIVLPSGETELVEPLWRFPFFGQFPGWEWLALTPSGWFNLTYLIFAVAFLLLARRHLRQPISLVPRSALGKGQMIYLGLLWVMVIGNFERALTGFTENRLLTEWIIFVNAVLCTCLVLTCPREKEALVIEEPKSFHALYRKAWGVGLVGMLLAVALFYSTTRAVYSDYFAGHAGNHKRFGPEADWRIKPMLKNEEHR